VWEELITPKAPARHSPFYTPNARCAIRDDFNFAIVNFPYTCSNIPLSPAYGVYISQLIRYTRTCSTYDQFLSRVRLLTDELMLQGFLQSRLRSAFRKFYGRYNDLIYNYKLSLSHNPVRIRVRIYPPHPNVCPKRLLIGRSFGWDRKNRGLVSQQAWHDKDPSLLKGGERRA
jgi:hypothetical protein